MAKASEVRSFRIINLELTESEAITLRKVCARISGSPVHTRRKHMDAIAQALTTVSIHAPYTEAIGSIDFPANSLPVEERS